MKKWFVIYPFIMAILPALYLYAFTTQELILSELLWPLGIALVLTLLVLLIAWLITRNLNKAGVIVAFFLLLFYTTGYVFQLQILWGVIGSVVAVFLLIISWAVLFPYISYRVLKARSGLYKPTIILNATTIIMLLMVSFMIGSAEAKQLDDGEYITQNEEINLDISGMQTLPDIYYIVLDRYASASTLAEFYDFDNNYFIQYLTDQGFYVASESAANYVRTSQSLASSLNMEYIDYMDEDSNDLVPLEEKIENNVLQSSLKSAGYKFINVGSWWDFTSENKYADININYGTSLSEFNQSVVSTTVPYSVLTKIGLIDGERKEQWERTIYEFDRMAEIPAMKEPTFTFAHLLITHEPYVFDSNGDFLSSEEVNQRSEKDNYVNTVVATNNMVEKLVSQLLSTSETAPIIILQADEGPYPERYNADTRNFKWEQATDEEIRQKMRIINAYYLPDMSSSALYPSISPVNSFRVIFDNYFGTNLGLLPDVNYTYVDYGHPYEFLDITDKVKFR